PESHHQFPVCETISRRVCARWIARRARRRSDSGPPTAISHSWWVYARPFPKRATRCSCNPSGDCMPLANAGLAALESTPWLWSQSPCLAECSTCRNIDASGARCCRRSKVLDVAQTRSEEHTSELQSRENL